MGSAVAGGAPRGALHWVGQRVNTSPANAASWLVSLSILAVVIPASEAVAANQVFFAAHDVSPVAWLVLLVLGVALGWLLTWVVLLALHRLLRPRGYDVAATGLTILVAWFLLGNILARTVFAAAPILGPIAGLVGALLVAALARRVAMGTILLGFAAVAAAFPLIVSMFSTDDASAVPAFAFDADPDRPSIVWVISDELQYPLVFTQDGEVRPEFPNLAALADQSTVYTKAYSSANYTDYAVPSMLNGISDVAAQGPDRMQDVRAGIGIIPGMAADYRIVMQSPIYSFDCGSSDCATVGVEEVGFVEKYASFAADTVAIAGRTALAEPFSGFFPSLDGKWRDFWAGGDEFGENALGNSVGPVIDGIASTAPEAPVFAFWHTIRTHAPWAVDREGRQIYPSRVPIVDGAHGIGEEANQHFTAEPLKHLQRRLYADSAVDFDRQLGRLIDELKSSGRYDNTMIVVTADHGATLTERSDRRVGDDLVQRWSEVAHVPLVIKQPGQQSADKVTEPRSTGQIAATVLATAGAQAGEGAVISPDLSSSLPGGPVFTTVAGGVLTPWPYSGISEVDPWIADDLSPPDPAHPYAVGLDTGLLGGPVPTGATPVQPSNVLVLPGESDQQVVIVDRESASCPGTPDVGMVAADGDVVGSVLWEGPAGSVDGVHTRGWAIVPTMDPAQYNYYCEAPVID